MNDGDPRPLRATGSCLCGGVQFEVRGPLRDVIVCHCGQCRRTHGHVSAYTSVARDDLALTSSDALAWYEASDRARRGFCRGCGASLFWEPKGEGRVAVSAGCLDLPTGLKTVRHIYVDDASDYYELTDGLPHDAGSHYQD